MAGIAIQIPGRAYSALISLNWKLAITRKTAYQCREAGVLRKPLIVQMTTNTLSGSGLQSFGPVPRDGPEPEPCAAHSPDKAQSTASTNAVGRPLPRTSNNGFGI